MRDMRECSDILKGMKRTALIILHRTAHERAGCLSAELKTIPSVTAHL